jgi:phosphoribosylanthranilate isomerase
MIVKICGITRLDDALAAIDAGADMLGYNFYPASKRYLVVQACEEIQAGLQRRGLAIKTVGVFVNATHDTITATLDTCDLDLAQLHGDEDPKLLASLGAQAFKAIRPRTVTQALSALDTYPPREAAPALLVDAYRPDQYGGTGHTGDWVLAADLATRGLILLAGGLHPGNVQEAIRQVQPWGVDVASGVESSPGVKERSLMEQFIRNARTAV